MQVNMHQAKTQLLRLGRLAWEGEQVVIAKAGELHLRLEPYKKPVVDHKPSRLKDRIWVAPDFDETADDEVDSFYASSQGL